MNVRFAALGRVGLSVDGTDIAIRGRRERAVLALLLAARGQVVPAERLMADVWGEQLRDSTPGSLQVAVSRLRALIEPDRARGAEPAVLVTRGAGYALLPPADSVDAERFTALVAAAASAQGPQEVLALCDEAGSLWRGPAFGGELDAEALRFETTRLDDLRLHAQELRAQALLDLGHHERVAGELEALVQAHPLRERRWELLVVALYRSGRQGEALAALRSARAVLADELGVDPAPGLRQLETDVLAQAPSLSLSRPGAEPAQGQPALAPLSLVGRTAALAGLLASLERSLAGAQQTALVDGEAGIGKTRLVTELAEQASGRGARVLWGRSHEADYCPAYWPWLGVVRELSPAPGSLVAALLSPVDTSVAGVPAAAELAVFDAVALLVAQRAADQPLLIVLDDLQWADPLSLRLLAYLAGALPDDRVLLVATLRDTTAPAPALEACLGALGRRQARRTRLTGLDRADVGRLVGLTAGSPADDELASVIAERTDGNPFYVIELVRLLAAEQRLHSDGARQVPAPQGVQDVLRLRLGALPDPAVQLLRVGALLGRDFPLDVVSEVTGIDADRATQLMDDAFCTEDGEQPGRYRFGHALVRETVLGSLSTTRTGRLHAAIAAALEPRLTGDPELIGAVAHHFLHGATVQRELADRAVQHAGAAARLAERRGALDEELTHWEQAQAAEALTLEPGPRRRYEVLLGLGRARYRQGQLAGSREALDAAVVLARGLDDTTLVAEAATSFRGAGLWRWRELGEQDDALVATLRECVTALPTGRLLARVLASLAVELSRSWSTDEASTIGGQAVELARALQDPDLFADVAALQVLVLWGRPGAADQRLALVAEVLQHPLDQERELYARFGAATAHLQLGDPDAADQEMIRCSELARRLRHNGADVPLAWWRFSRAVAAGDAPATAALAEDVISRHRGSQAVAVAEAVPLAQLRAGGPGTRVPDAAVALATGNANPAFRALVAHALTECGRTDEAPGLLGEPVPNGAWNYCSTYGDCLRVDVLAAAGPSLELATALARIEPWGHEVAAYGSTDCLGSIEYFVGRGREGLGDVDGARRAYELAVDRNRGMGIIPWLHRAQERLAALPLGSTA